MPPAIYMDANATTPLLPAVFEAMRPFLLGSYGNPSSIHRQGQHARAAVDRARDQVARLLRARASEIVFTSGGTESDNLALFGVLKPGDHLVTAATEHHAVLHAAQALEKRGVEVTYLACDPSGLIPPSALQAALRPNTRLVSLMLANNETGTIQPIAALAAIAKAHGALFHTDAVQAAGKLALDLGLTCAVADPSGQLKDVDLLSLSGHKMYAPQGIGVLFVRRHVVLAPLFHGGMHERQRRAGTENVAAIVALGEAAEQARHWLNAEPATHPGAPPLASERWEEPPRNPTAATNQAHHLNAEPKKPLGAPLLASERWEEPPRNPRAATNQSHHHLNAEPETPGAPSFPASSERVGCSPILATQPQGPPRNPAELARLRDTLEQALLDIPHSGVNGAGTPRTPNTTNVYFDGIDADALLIALDLAGLAVSAGSACQSGATEPSHVLTAMGLTPARAKASIRISLSRLTTAEEIGIAASLITEAVHRQRSTR